MDNKEGAASISIGNQENPTSSNYFDSFRALGKVLNEVGISGFIVISIVVFIYTFASSTQKEEIIDTWLLFNGPNNNPYFIVIFILVILILSQQIHYKRLIKMKDERIKELAGEKTSSYSIKLRTTLSSSQPKQKKK